ncbi:CCC motif membrane protein [Algibacter miyuki]|uniref:CCC motif membrane protein n=1 Tax=Algibacter miyuki TaxID=1306933 RepID=A0ABV5H0P5_9FLAO|nr:CCC motif membrane protein [Algibacter miyuki]MDN3664131.1 CCC motif membrane protein [Algibacter miyuki]
MEQEKLNATLVYVLSIIGLLCCCIAGSGFILAGIAFFIANSKINAAKANPEQYDPASVKAMNTAKTVALVILIINILYLIYSIYQIATIGWDQVMIQSQEIMEQYQSQQ